MSVSLFAALLIAHGPLSITLAPATVVGGNPTTATVTLGAPAPSGGVEITLSSSNAAVAQFGSRLAPAIGTSQLTIPAGALVGTFPVRTFSVAASTTVTLKATSRGTAVTTTLTVTLASVKALALSPSTVLGGNAVSATVTLNGPAPAGGLTVPLSVTRPLQQRPTNFGGVATVTFPPNVVVPAGATQQSLTVGTGPVTTAQSVQIVAGSPSITPPSVSDGTSNTITIGASPAPASVSATLTITPPPPPVVTVSVTPSPTIGGVPVTVTVAVVPNGSPPSSVTLSTDHPELLQLPPNASFPTLSGSADATTSVTAPTRSSSADQSVTVTAQAGGGTGSTTLLVKQTPPAIASFTLRPASVHGGGNAVAQLATSPTLAAAVTVTLTTNHPELVTLPPPFALSPSPVPTPLTLKTSPTAAPVSVTITATAGTQTTTVTLSVVP